MAREEHADDLSGKGAEVYGGRWNQVGVSALYAAENISLTILETIVHSRNIKDLYGRLLLSIQVPDTEIETIDIKKSPSDWNSTPWNSYTVSTGTKWLNSFNGLAMKVPSALVPQESIYILNPRVSDFKKVRIVKKQVFIPDHRLVLYEK